MKLVLKRGHVNRLDWDAASFRSTYGTRLSSYRQRAEWHAVCRPKRLVMKCALPRPRTASLILCCVQDRGGWVDWADHDGVEVVGTVRLRADGGLHQLGNLGKLAQVQEVVESAHHLVKLHHTCRQGVLWGGFKKRWRSPSNSSPLSLTSQHIPAFPPN